MGGIGNQLFQIANSFSKSIKHNVNFALRKHSQTELQGNNASYYINNIYKKFNFLDVINTDIRITENDWSFKEVEIPNNKSIEFFGYYQSSKNFKGYEKEIINMFSPDNNFKNKMLKKYDSLNKEKTVSVHIRRGDYLKFLNIHPVISESYINECLRQISDYDHVFIFTDDKKWVIDNLKIENSTIVSEEDWEELWMMSMCKYNVISNSTFSWWGSYLNLNPDKKIYCPSVWFSSEGPKNYSDIFEDNFIIINSKIINGEIVYEN